MCVNGKRKNVNWIKELFFVWQDNTVFMEDVTYHNIVEFMNKNLTSEQLSELENLISEDTQVHMLEAFIGGFCVCRDLFLLKEVK